MDTVTEQRPQSPQQLLHVQLAAEADAMARFAFATGKPVSAAIVDALDRVHRDAERGAPIGFAAIARLHRRLADVIAPAQPGTVLLLRQAKLGGWAAVLGPVPTVRRIMGATLLSCACFIAVSLSPLISSESLSGNVLTDSGLRLLMVLVFILSASAMGACFQALFTVHRYINAGTYDPRYDSSYWIRIVLGLISGLVISQLIPFTEDDGGAVFTRPLLALVGGFSASLVYRILDRAVGTLESLFKGNAREAGDAIELTARARAAQEQLQQRAEMASGLLRLREQIASGAPSAQLIAQLASILSDVLPQPNEPDSPAVAP